MKHATGPIPRRRDEALAIVIDRLVRTSTSPTYEELGLAMRPPVSKARAQGLVEQLIARRIIEKTPGAVRALRVRDVDKAREILDQYARSLGWAVALPLGPLQAPLPHVQLPMLPPFEHLPDAE